MLDRYRFLALPFSPSEIEAITGINTTLQRDWRRRGILPRHKAGVAEFQPDEIAMILVLKALRTLTAGNIEVAAEHAAHVSRSILRHALTYVRAWRFDGSAEEKEVFDREVLKADMFGLAYINVFVGLRPEDNGWYSVWHGGRWRIVADIRDVFDIETDKEAGGIVLNHNVLGEEMASKLSHPLFAVKLRPGCRR